MTIVLLSSICFSFHAGMHAFFDKTASKRLMDLFKPQIVGEQILSTVGVNDYTKTRILLEDNKTSGVIFQQSYIHKSNIFVLQSNDECDSHTVISCLWSPEAPKTHCFKALQDYYNYWFPMYDIYAKQLTEEDQKLWEEIRHE